MQDVSTIKLGKRTKRKLDSFKQYKNETYDDVVNKLMFVVENLDDDPELSEQTVKEIEQARARIKAGKFYTEEEMAKKLGL